MKQETLENIHRRMRDIFWHECSMERVNQPVDMVTTLYRLHTLKERTDDLREAVMVGSVPIPTEYQWKLDKLARLFVLLSQDVFEISAGIRDFEMESYSIRNGGKKYFDGRLRGHRRNTRQVVASVLYCDPDAGRSSTDFCDLSDYEARTRPSWSTLLGMAGKPKYAFWLCPILLNRIRTLQKHIQVDLIRAGAHIKNKAKSEVP